MSHDCLVFSSTRSSRLIQVVVGLLLMAALAVFFVINGLDRSDKYASVIGAFAGLAGLGLTVHGAIGGLGGQSGALGKLSGEGGPKGTFYILNGAAGLALTVADGSGSSLPVYGRPLSGSPQQRWRVERTKQRGEFLLVSEASGLALDATKARPGGQNLACAVAFGGAGQRWNLTPIEKGTYTIKSVAERVDYLSMNEKAEDWWQPWFKSSVEDMGQRWEFKEAR